MSLTLLDWRRRVLALYADVRAASDPAGGQQVWSAGRDELLRTHPDSPVPSEDRATYPGAPLAPYDPRFRFEAPLDRDVEPAHRDVQTGTDGVVGMDRLGVLHLDRVGDLDVWWMAQYGGGLFVPLKDATSGRTSYGGGRYLLDTGKGSDLGGDVGPDGSGTLVVDLNLAYNPSCAYDPAWACPLPGPGSTVRVEVTAGEQHPRA